MRYYQRCYRSVVAVVKRSIPFRSRYVRAFDEQAARHAGQLLAAAKNADRVDASVVVGTHARDDHVIMSDADDLYHLDAVLNGSMTFIDI